ncbi:MAG: segregation/condensation protein A, partial [Evtepia sp.]
MEQPIYHLEGVLKTKGISDFIGPIDLILHLLSKHKLEIRDVSISEILEQYLIWMDNQPQTDLEVASDFIAMASHLLYIKTAMLLSADDTEALSELEQLMRSLEERKHQEEFEQLKPILPILEQNYLHGRDVFIRAPEPRPFAKVYQHSPSDLLNAMSRLLERNNRKKTPSTASFIGIVGREIYPVARKAQQILKTLLQQGTQTLKKLFHKNRTRSELVATFLSILE